MALSSGDWAEALTHMRVQVREAGLSDLDERVILDFRTTPSSSADFRRYLDSLISALGERSYSTFQRSLDVFRQSLECESGEPIEGIEVRVEERDFAVYATNRIDLAQQQDLTPVIEDLKQLRQDLLAAGVLDEQDGA
jgi:hypothetical protein